jgi:hypothetical protein
LSILPSPATSFYVFPVENLYDNKGLPTTTNVFTVIYNDVLGRSQDVFLFSSEDAFKIGDGLPYAYCPDSSCGPLCFGTCKGEYTNCRRGFDQNFGCLITVSWQCKTLALLPFLIPTVLCLITAIILILKSKFMPASKSPTAFLPIPRRKVYGFSRKTKITVSVLFIIAAILCIIMLILATVDTEASDWYLRRVCAISGDYQ